MLDSKLSDRARLERALAHPIWFSDQILGQKTWPQQANILKSIGKSSHVAVKSCNASGKTHSMAIATLWFLQNFRPSIVITTAPTGRQVELIMWNTIRTVYANSRVPLGGDLQTRKLFYKPDHYAYGFSSDKIEKYQGFHSEHILLIVDEASGVDEGIFDALEGNMSTGDPHQVLIGNPTSASGRFYDAFHRHRDRWTTHSIGYQDTPNFQGNGIVAPYLITPEWVEDRREVWGEQSALFEVRCLGNFPTEGIGVLIPLSWVEGAQRRSEEVLPTVPYEIGVDVARFGDDETAMHMRQGPKSHGLSAWSGMDIMTSAHRVRKLANDTMAKRHSVVTVIRVDSIGIGAGLADRLREFQATGDMSDQIRVIDVNVGEAARDPEAFPRRRDEMYWAMRSRFQDGMKGPGQICNLPQDKFLEAQLTSIKYEYDLRGRVKAESKDDMRKRGLSSPDRAEAVLLSYADDGRRLKDSVQDYTKTAPIFGDLMHKTW